MNFKVHRTEMRNATWHDYIWMYFLAFAVGAIVFWFVTIRFIGGTTHTRTVGRFARQEIMESATPQQARRTMLKMTVLGGALGMGGLALWQLKDRQDAQNAARGKMPSDKHKGQAVRRRDDS